MFKISKSAGTILLGLALAPYAEGSSYISCQTFGIGADGTGGFDSDCRISENVVIAPKTPVERKIVVTYQFKCLGDDVEIGLKEQSRGTSYRMNQSAEWQSLLVTGYGPINLVDFNPDDEWTQSASFQRGCSLLANVSSADLSESEKRRLNDAVDAVAAQGKIVTDLAPLVSSVAVLRTIMNQLDIPSIVALLRDKYNTTLSLKNRFDELSMTESSSALDLVLSDLKLGICLNPALVAENQDICVGTTPTETSSPNGDAVKRSLVTKAVDALTEIETAEARVKRSAGAAVSAPSIVVSELLAFASQETKAPALLRFCPALKAVSVRDANCPN